MKNKTLNTRKARHFLYALLALVLCGGCYRTEVHETVNRTKYIDIETEVVVRKINSSKDYSIVTIDSCEYVVYHYDANSVSGWSKGGITHKGNCKYCAKRALAN